MDESSITLHIFRDMGRNFTSETKHQRASARENGSCCLLAERTIVEILVTLESAPKNQKKKKRLELSCCCWFWDGKSDLRAAVHAEKRQRLNKDYD